MTERAVSEVVADLRAIHPTATGREAAALLERLDADVTDCKQDRASFRQELIDARGHEDDILRLAEVIMHEVPGEPSQSEGAIDCAIRLLRKLAIHDADNFHSRWWSANDEARRNADARAAHDLLEALKIENAQLRRAAELLQQNFPSVQP